jgi:hypothetical protein
VAGDRKNGAGALIRDVPEGSCPLDSRCVAPQTDNQEICVSAANRFEDAVDFCAFQEHGFQGYSSLFGEFTRAGLKFLEMIAALVPHFRGKLRCYASGNADVSRQRFKDSDQGSRRAERLCEIETGPQGHIGLGGSIVGNENAIEHLPSCKTGTTGDCLTA